MRRLFFFFHIISKVEKKNAVGILGSSSLQKIANVLRMLAYGVTGDYVDESLKIP
jgi:hypothetical protein